MIDINSQDINQCPGSSAPFLLIFPLQRRNIQNGLELTLAHLAGSCGISDSTKNVLLLIPLQKMAKNTSC